MELEFENVKNKFASLIKEGEDFINCLIKEKKDKSKAVSTSLITPFEEQSQNLKARKRFPESVSKNSIKKFVQQIFTHYDVNPSIEEITNRIIATYVNKDLEVIKYLRKDLYHVVNEDDSLFHEILNLFKRVRQKEDIHQEERKIYITGIRGAGKTTYLNYFISKYEKPLNESNIISIRINVLRIHNISLEEAIKFKTCRILFTYYCTFQSQDHERLNGRNIKNNINDYLKDIIKDHSNDFRQYNINICSDFFKKYNSKEPRRIPSEHVDLCNLLLANIVKDYNFIIMLDNFDQVTPNDKGKYNKRMVELQTINTSDLFNYSVYIIAIRYSTFNALPNVSRTKKSCRVIGTPSTYNMLEKRMRFYLNDSSSPSNAKKLTCLKSLIILIGRNFMPNKKNIMPNNLKEACDLFDEIYYADKRIVINMLNRFINIIPQSSFEKLCEYDYENVIDSLFDKLISHTYYKFFESLLINTDTGYCNSFFEYKFENNKYLFSHINATAHFDEKFLPNLYRFAAKSRIRGVQFVPFLKIRILQLLKNYENKNDDRLTQNDVAKILSEIFGYRKDVIHVACEELRWDQSIIIIEKEPENDDEHREELRNMPLDITSRGKKLLIILPININLLAVDLEQIFLPISFVKNSKMPIGNYNDPNISEFIVKNIFFSLPKAIGLFKSMEKYERSILANRTKDSNKLYFVDSDFEIGKELEKISFSSIESIYYSYFEVKSKDTKYIRRKEKLIEQLGI